ncbi:hypothetical protein [Aliidiomarina indica]|uniref:hypothetical protein n=1 Tax=Aliidiomarina indica TaxID=2749147 RepID=UPI00188F7CB4|nr:hypothetical protein [Aliidiomarina indica]
MTLSATRWGRQRGFAIPAVLILVTLSSVILLGVIQEALLSTRLTSLDVRIARADRLLMSAQARAESYLRGQVTNLDAIETTGFTLSITLEEQDCPEPQWYCTQVDIYIAHDLQDVARHWQGIWRVIDTGDDMEMGWWP